MERIYSSNNNLSSTKEYDGETIREFNFDVEFIPTNEDDWYTVKVDDDLFKIAREKYKDSSKWELIARANKIINPFSLTIGNILLIPKEK